MQKTNSILFDVLHKSTIIYEKNKSKEMTMKLAKEYLSLVDQIKAAPTEGEPRGQLIEAEIVKCQLLESVVKYYQSVIDNKAA